MALTSVSFAMMNFASVSTTVALVYNVNDIIVNGCVLVFLISFIVMNFFTVYALEWSVSKTFKICSVMIILGAWLRYFLVKYDN